MLNFEVSGNGREPLVLLHGFMENLSVWDDMEKTLSRDFILVKIDLPGHGHSDLLAKVQTMEMMAEEVKKVTDDLDFEHFHLLGHSMGGYISLAFAEKYPEKLKTLTLFFSTSLPDSEEKKAIRKRSTEIIDKDFSLFISSSIPGLFNENEKDILEGKIKLAKKTALSTDPEGAKASQLGMAERPDRTFVLDNFGGKILVLTGRHDNAVKAETLLKHLPDRSNIKAYMLECGHSGHWERPEICAAILNQELLHDLPKNLVF